MVFHETSLRQCDQVLDFFLARLPEQTRKERISALKQTLLLKSKSETNEGFPGLFHWKREDKIIGVLYTFLRPDKTILTLPPVVLPDEPPQTLEVIYDWLIEHATANHSPVVMMLVDNDQEIDAVCQTRAKFRKISDLLYLVCESGLFPKTSPAEKLRFVPYTPRDWAKMVDLVEQTYRETKDFPSLNGICPTESILSSYMEDHPFIPDLWFFIEYQNRPIGTLILTELEKSKMFELTYMGIVPEFRGKNLAHEIVAFTKFVAGKHNSERLLVSVDIQNEPAINVYSRHDFQVYDRKEIYARFMPKSF